MQITRRAALLKGTALVSAALVLQAGSCVPTTPATVVAQAGAVANGLAGMLKQVVAAYPSLIPAALATQAESYLALASTAAGQLSPSLTAPAGASLAQTVVQDVNAVLNLLAGPPINGLIPAPFNEVVAAAAIVAPQIEAFAAAYLTTAAASPAVAQVQAKFAAAAPTVTADNAMLILQSYAAH